MIYMCWYDESFWLMNVYINARMLDLWLLIEIQPRLVRDLLPGCHVWLGLEKSWVYMGQNNKEVLRVYAHT